MKTDLKYIWQAIPYKYGHTFPDDNYYKSVKDAQRRADELMDKGIFDKVELRAIRLQ